MANKPNKIEVPAGATSQAPNGVAAIAQADDLRKLRQFLTPQKSSDKQEDLLLVAGHNVVVDRRTPDTIRIEIGTDADCFDNMYQKTKKDGSAGGRFLALTKGAMFDSCPITIGGARFFLTVKVEKYDPKQSD